VEDSNLMRRSACGNGPAQRSASAEAQKPPQFGFAEGRVRPSSNRFMRAANALRRLFVDARPASSAQIGRVESPAANPAEVPSGANPRGPPSTGRPAGAPAPWPGLALVTPLDSRSQGLANPDGANVDDQSRAPARRRTTTSSTTSEVEASPPRSKVRIPSAAAPSVARRIPAAASATAASPRAA